MSPMALFAQEEKLRPSTELSDGWRNLSEEVKQVWLSLLESRNGAGLTRRPIAAGLRHPC